MHGTLLDRHRPLWESHLVEGLNDGRIAVYTKIHHALVDGVSAMQMMRRALSEDPEDHEIRVPWALNGRRPSGKAKAPASPLKGLLGVAESIVGLGPSVLHLANKGLLQQQLTLPVGAPKTIFNVPIGGARRVAAQSWPIERFTAIKKAAGVTLNDVVLAVCGGALRAYLLEQKALPDRPLIAMVPVSVRSGSETDAYQNRVSALLADLATNEADPVKRLRRVQQSMTAAKENFAAIPAEALQDFTQFAPPAVAARAMRMYSRLRIADRMNPPFNLVISNVPGPGFPLYSAGAQLQHFYPVSALADGQGLNMTVQSYNGNLDFGFIACRDLVPDLWVMVDLLRESMDELLAL
jgi:diacylglycerol O-acyltransferase